MYSSLLERFFKVLTRGVVLAAGGAAGIAALFSVPIAASIFAHEMLLRRFRSTESLPVIMAAWVDIFLRNAPR